jgi:hypothetical protein
MKVGLHYHGLCYDFETHRLSQLSTPDGHMYGRPIFVRELHNRGHSIFQLGQRRETWFNDDSSSKLFVDAFEREDYIEKFPDIDVLFLEWRWKTWKNDKNHPDHVPSKYEPDYDRQLELIEHYRHICPIIVWDTDLKITRDDEERWPELIILDPSLKTNRLTRDRISMPFWTDWKELMNVSEPYPVLGYIGNNYERDDEFRKFYFNNASMLREEGIQTTMHGNWLQKSPERVQPSQLISEHRDVAFNHRMNFFDSMNMLNKFVCTVHVSKQRYYEVGFISPRYLETLATNCPALVPESQSMNSVLGKEWIVGSGSDVFEKTLRLSKLTIAQRAEIVQEQRKNLQASCKFDVSSIVDFIESVC